MACNNPCINLPAENLHCRGCRKVVESNFRFRCYRTPSNACAASIGITLHPSDTLDGRRIKRHHDVFSLALYVTMS